MRFNCFFLNYEKEKIQIIVEIYIFINYLLIDYN